MTVMNIIKLNKIDLSTFITIPEVIKQKQQTNSNGFLMGVLNLTIDNAPTIPSDNARLLDIMEVIRQPTNGRIEKFNIESLFLSQY